MLNVETIGVRCCGCGACSQSCQHGCIEMKPDAEGFLRPFVSKEKCTRCGKCDQACPVLSQWNYYSDSVFKKPKAYGGRHKDDEVLQTSSSGGAFTLLSEPILKSGGVVVGCTLDEHNKAIHAEVDSVSELYKLRKSKYVQSEIGDIYLRIKQYLSNDRYVLFVGTPCQAAGLCNFLHKKYDKLYVVDFICHGVPSPIFFEKYVEYLSKSKGLVKKFEFRVKDKGWQQSGLQLGTRIEYESGEVQRNYPAFKDPYMNGFLNDVCLRPSCYDCDFKEIPKNYADYTIADFWGIDAVDAELNNGKGTSLVLLHNEHALSLWNEIQDNFIGHEVDFDASIKKNPTLYKSANYRKERTHFFDDLNRQGFEWVKTNYLSAATWFLHKLGNVLGERIIQFLKFGLVGVSNTMINLFIYYSLLFMGSEYRLAYTIGFLVSVCNAFYWNNRYVFKNKQETNYVKLFIKVLASYGFCFLASLVLLTVMVDWMHISSLLAPIIKLCLTIPLNFFLNKRWAFKDKLISLGKV